MESNFPFHPTSFCPTRSLRMEKTCFFDLPMKDGRPRYLECFESCIGPKMEEIASFKSWWVFGLKNTEDLSVLIFWSEASSYLWKIYLSSWHSSVFALQNRMLSSAKKRWVMLGQFWEIEMPVRRWFLAASWIMAKSPSAQRRKWPGEKGSPCLRPLEGIMFS